MGTKKAVDKDLFERLRSQEDVTIGGEVYRCSALELRIKYCGKGHGWKLLKKFDSLEDLATYWDQLVGPLGMNGKAGSGQIIVRECVDACAVLPPDSGAVLPHTPQALTEQYNRAMAGLRECLRFGAMIVEIDAGLKRAARNQYTEDTLSAWLTANCPEVNYAWAMKYKRLAEGLRNKFNLSDKVTLSLAITTADGTPADDPEVVSAKRAEKVRKEVDAFLAGKTAWQLEFAFGLRTPAAPKGGDVKSGKKLTEEEKHLRERKEAKERWDKLAANLSVETKTYKSHLLLDGSVIDALLLKLDVVRDCLKDAKGKE